MAADHTASPEFLDLLAHELRAPLFPIIALSDLLLDADERMIASGEWRDHLQLIARSGKTMLDLIDDLLGITRIDNGRTRTTPGPVNLAHFADTVRERHRGAVLVGVSPRSVALDVYTDRDAIDRASECLLGHALTDTPGEAATLQIESNDRALQLRVDTRGMSRAELDALFSPFWQRQDDSEGFGKARGLSLTLARKWAELAGGRTSARAEGDRTAIEVEIPCSPIDRRRMVQDTLRIAIGSTAPRFVYRAALDLLALGHDVRIAHSEQELAELASSPDLDLVISDTRLPAPPRVHPRAASLSVAHPEGLDRAGLAALLERARKSA